MAFRQKAKQAFVPGKSATVILNGMEFSGEVVEFESMNPADAHLALKQEDGSTYILAVSPQMVVVIPPPGKGADVENDMETEDEETVEATKAPTKTPPVPPSRKTSGKQDKK